MKRKPNGSIKVGRDAKTGRFVAVKASRGRAKRLVETVHVSRARDGRFR